MTFKITGGEGKEKEKWNNERRTISSSIVDWHFVRKVFILECVKPSTRSILKRSVHTATGFGIANHLISGDPETKSPAMPYTMYSFRRRNA